MLYPLSPLGWCRVCVVAANKLSFFMDLIFVVAVAQKIKERKLAAAKEAAKQAADKAVTKSALEAEDKEKRKEEEATANESVAVRRRPRIARRVVLNEGESRAARRSNKYLTAHLTRIEPTKRLYRRWSTVSWDTLCCE